MIGVALVVIGAVAAVALRAFRRPSARPLEEQTDAELQRDISQMLGMSRGISTAMDKQLSSIELTRYPDAKQLVQETREAIDMQASSLADELESLHGGGASRLKSVAATMAGTAAGLFEAARTSNVSSMLRDDYTALSMASVSYTMLHTTGLSLHRESVASMAQAHLQQLTPLIVRFGEELPNVVVTELARDYALPVDVRVSQQAVEDIQHAWSRTAMAR